MFGEQYKPEDVLDAGIKSGVYYQGKFQLKGSDEAWVSISDANVLGGRDILIPSKVMRNRAIHGDVVAVEVCNADKCFFVDL